MSLIITGASGQLGRHAAELVLTTDGIDPADVVLVTRSPDGLADLAGRGARVRTGDFSDPSTLPSAFAGGQRLLLVSTGEFGPARVVQHRAAIDAASSAGVQFIAYTSVPNPDPEGNPAAVVADHAETERAIADSGIAHAFLRNALYSDFKIPEARAAIADGVYAYNTGDGVSAHVSREDCAAAAAAVLTGGSEHAGAAYDITGPEALSGADLAALYASVGGSPVRAVAMDDETWIADQLGRGLPESYAGLAASFGRAVAVGALDQLSDDVHLLTGRRPRSVREMLVAAGVGDD